MHFGPDKIGFGDMVLVGELFFGKMVQLSGGRSALIDDRKLNLNKVI